MIFLGWKIQNIVLFLIGGNQCIQESVPNKTKLDEVILISIKKIVGQNFYSAIRKSIINHNTAIKFIKIQNMSYCISSISDYKGKMAIT